MKKISNRNKSMLNQKENTNKLKRNIIKCNNLFINIDYKLYKKKKMIWRFNKKNFNYCKITNIKFKFYQMSNNY